MKQIKFKLLTQDKVETVEGDVKTVGNLKNLIRNNAALAGKISLETKIINEGGFTFTETVSFIEKNTLAEYGTADEAILPAGDCFFYVTPIRTKSGIEVSDLTEKSITQIEEELDELGYNELRSFGSKLNKDWDAKIDLGGKRVDMLENILDFVFDYYEGQKGSEGTEVLANSVDLMVEATNLILQFIETYKPGIQYVDGITHEELHAKALRVKEMFNNKR